MCSRNLFQIRRESGEFLSAEDPNLVTLPSDKVRLCALQLLKIWTHVHTIFRVERAYLTPSLLEEFLLFGEKLGACEATCIELDLFLSFSKHTGEHHALMDARNHFHRALYIKIRFVAFKMSLSPFISYKSC